MIFDTPLGKAEGIACGISENNKQVYEFHSIPYTKAGRFVWDVK